MHIHFCGIKLIRIINNNIKIVYIIIYFSLEPLLARGIPLYVMFKLTTITFVKLKY